MIRFTKDEITRLIANNAKKVGYTSTYYDDDKEGHDGDEVRAAKSQHKTRWVAVSVVVLLVAGLLAATGKLCLPCLITTKEEEPGCRFCDQSVPELHEDESYVVEIPDLSSPKTKTTTATVTPMTISYEYELRDGENLFTDAMQEHIPNQGFDYAVLGVTGFRNLHQLDRSPVSLDEVYVHHFSLFPLNMLGAEVLARNDANNNSDDYLRFPPGYALHILADEYKNLLANAHLISNKNLEPIGGSPERAHKECNECYYAPTKGSDCTPEVSGTFLCCGDSPACTTGGELCACATTTAASTTTKYRLELDLLIAREMDKFTRVDQWNLDAPSCSVNLEGDPVFEEYAPDNYCHKNSLIGPEKKNKTNKNQNSNKGNKKPLDLPGRGSLFHQIPERPDQDPTVRTATTLLAPAGGTLVWAQSHLHTGGVNATLYRNGRPLCSTSVVYGTDPDPSTNARNEKGHLVEIGSCYEAVGPEGIRFERGDVFTTESYYYGAQNDPNLGPIVGGEHKNVMSMFFLGVVFDWPPGRFTERRTSFNYWMNFVPIAGILPHRLPKPQQHQQPQQQNLRSASSASF